MIKLEPRIGVGVVIERRNYISPYNGTGIIFLRREGTSHGNGEWSFPGGRLEYMESLIDCAVRETLEEVSIDLLEPHLLPLITEDKFPIENMHWITHYVMGHCHQDQMPKIMEPNKANGLYIGWEPPKDESLFIGVAQIMKYLNYQ